MDLISYIVSEGLILIPVLYLIGLAIKQTPNIKDWLIPYILGALGILGAICLMGLSMQSVIQGILIAGAAVYTNQTIKQTVLKGTEDNNEEQIIEQ